MAGGVCYVNAAGEITTDQANFAWDYTNNRLGIGTDTPLGQLHLAQAAGANAANPTLAFGDGNSGFYESADNTIAVALGGTRQWRFHANWFAGTLVELTDTVSVTIPMYTEGSDLDTGIGFGNNDILTLITGGIERVRIDANGNINFKTGTLTTSSLTAGRVLFAGTNGLISDDADLTYDATNNNLTAAGRGRFDGGLWCDGTTGATPTSGAGTRLMWIPDKAAFRAGAVGSSQWDAGNIGQWSVAFGTGGRASGNYSAHFGENGQVSAPYSTHFGDGGVTSGSHSTHFGSGGVTSGSGSTHFGLSGTVSGTFSIHTGEDNLADCYGLLTLGRFSAASGGNLTTWVATDPILIIGNGTSAGARSTVLTILKNGNITTDGNLAGVDITASGTITDGIATIVGGLGTFATVNITNESDALQIDATTILHTDGTNNFSMGAGAGAGNSGSGCFFLGKDAGGDTNAGDFNLAMGFEAGLDLTSGVRNALVGYRAGQNITSGDENLCFGPQTGEALTTEDRNVFIGWECGLRNTASRSTCIGAGAGRYTTGQENVCIGYLAGQGVDGSSTFTRNTIIGTNAGSVITTAGATTLIGNAAGAAIIGGGNNTLIGESAGRLITTGTQNVIIGANAGYSSAVNIDRCIFLGANAGRNVTIDDILAIENRNQTSATNAIIYGVMDATAADQTLRINATVTTSYGRIVGESRYTTTQTLDNLDHIVSANTDGGAWTLSLPAGVVGTVYEITNTGDSSNNLTIAPNGAEHLIGVNANWTLLDGETLKITYRTSDGWY